ncbi:MAG: PAS domain S-box protein [Phycisphaerae bacterium]|nr:PAS domain S-box protein [Phycisphaerae bacterium]
MQKTDVIRQLDRPERTPKLGYEAVARSLPGAVYQCAFDERWTMSLLTDAIKDIAGHPASDFIDNHHRSFASIVHPGDLFSLEETVSEAVARDEPYRLQHRILHVDGGLRWVSNRGRGVLDPAGRLLYLVGTLLDITERKASEARLFRAQSAVDDATDAVLVVEREGSVSYANMAFGDLFRCTQDTLAEQAWEEIFADRSVAQEIMARVGEGYHWLGEVQMVSSEGRTFPADVRATPVLDESAVPSGALLIISDITDRKLAEQEVRRLNEDLEQRVAERAAELARANEKLQREVVQHMYTEQALRKTTGTLNSILASSTEFAIVATDLERRILHWNPTAERILGRRADKVVGQSARDALCQDATRPEWFEQAVEAVQRESKYECDVTIGADRASQRTIHFVVMAMRDGSGQGIGYILFASDVTERRRAEDELEQYRNRLEELVIGRTAELEETNRDLQEEITERKQAEEAVRESKQLLQSIFDAINDGISVLDRDLNIVRVNPWMERAWAEQMPLVGKKCYEAYQMRTSPCPDCPSMKAVESGQPFQTLMRYPKSSGEVEWADLSALPLRDATGQVVGVIQYLKDVTERKHAEEALSEQKELLTSVLTNIPHSVFWKDMGSVYLGCNEAFARAAGLSRPGDVIGKTDFDLPWDRAEAERYRQIDKMVIASGEPVLDMEQTQRRPDGKEAITLTSNVPLRDACGEVTGVLGMFADITERKQIERKLVLSQMALDDASDAIMVMDRDLTVAYINMAFADLLRFTVDMVNDEGWESICVDRAKSLEILCTVNGGDSWNGELQLVSREGREFPAEVRATPIVDERVTIAGMFLMIQDITDRKRLQRQALQTQKLESIGQLAAGIAHEINTPTQYIGDNTHFLQDAFGDLSTVLDQFNRLLAAAKDGKLDEQIIADVDQAIEEADLGYLSEEIPSALSQALEGIDRVSTIVRAMKDFSHPGVEGRTNADINRAIESTITVARNEWKYVAEVVTDFDPDLPLVSCLVGEFNQVILNILINAAHAISDVIGEGGGDRGTIAVATRRAGAWAEIRIKDTGAGIPEHVRPKVFDPFFTTKGVGKGTGQGLAIAHSVVTEKHGGTIEFETELGKGTTFTIRLPIVPTGETCESQSEVAHVE